MAWLTPPPGRSCATNSCGWRPLQATTGLVSSMLPFGESEDRLWAKELLSSSFLGAQAYSDPQLDPPPAPPHEDWDNPVAALHCAEPTVPGTTGTRPEHITDLLNVPRWVHATKVHAALTILVWRLSAGSLPLGVWLGWREDVAESCARKVNISVVLVVMVGRTGKSDLNVTCKGWRWCLLKAGSC